MAGNKKEEEKRNGRHGWKRSDSKNIIRMDHSSVYIVNERLGDDLEDKMANIHRSRYRQFLHRDSEITQLKQSLARMRQGSMGGSILTRTAFGQNRRSLSTLPLETATTSFPNEAKVPKNQRRTSPTTSATQHGRRSATPTSSPKRFRKISITMPDAEKDVYDSDSSNSHDSDNSDDDDEIDIKTDDSEDETRQDNKHHSRPMSRRAKIPKKGNNTIPRSKSCTFDDKGYTSNRNLSLKKLMKMLKIDRIPPSWYTSVVPASDVSVFKRPGRSGLSDLTNPSNNPHVKSWLPSKMSSNSPLSKSSNSPMERRQHTAKNDPFPLRPHTSLGVSRTSENKQTGAVAQEDTDNNNNNNNNNSNNSPRSGGRKQPPTRRPMTAMVTSQSLRQSASASPSTKTVRQLKELSEQDEQAVTISSKPRTGVELLLDETREKRKVIDHKVNLFLRSLDELEKVRRWKAQGLNVQPLKSTSPPEYTAASPAAGLSPFTSGPRQTFVSSDSDKNSCTNWRQQPIIHVQSLNATGLLRSNALRGVVKRPTTVS